MRQELEMKEIHEWDALDCRDDDAFERKTVETLTMSPGL